MAEVPAVIKSESEVSFELDATCIDENNDQSSGPISIQSNDRKPSELELEEPASAKNIDEYFIIKEIGATKTDDVEYVVKCEYQNDDAKQDDRNDDIDLGQRRTFRACRERSKLKETSQQKQERLLDEIIAKQTQRSKVQRIDEEKNEQQPLTARIYKRKSGEDQNEQQKVHTKINERKCKANETIEQREKRLMIAKIRQRKCMANETFEQKEKRLLREKIRAQQVRENETSEQKEQRLLKYRCRQRKRMERETSEQREKRLLRDKMRLQKVRTNETLEQKQQRLLDQKLRQRKRVESETTEERKKRLIAGRIRYQRHREREQKVSTFRDYQRQCSEKMVSEVEEHLCVTICKEECVDE